MQWNQHQPEAETAAVKNGDLPLTWTFEKAPAGTPDSTEHWILTVTHIPRDSTRWLPDSPDKQLRLQRGDKVRFFSPDAASDLWVSTRSVHTKREERIRIPRSAVRLADGAYVLNLEGEVELRVWAQRMTLNIDLLTTPPDDLRASVEQRQGTVRIVPLANP